MEREKVITADGVRLPDRQHMKDIDETGCTYLRILKSDTIKEKKMKEKFSKEYLRQLRLILRSKLNGRNEIMTVNTCAVSVLRYGAGILKCSAANKGQPVVNYCQSPAFDHPYLSCDDHCDSDFSKKSFFFYQYNFYFLEILLNDLELVFLEFKYIYKTQRSSLFSFYLFIFYLLFHNL